MSVTFYSRERDGKGDPSAYDYEGPDFANGNAVAVLSFLGYDVWPDDTLTGELEPDDLIGRCLTALAVGGVGHSDEGSPAIASGGNGRATWVECGRRPGYFRDACEQLAARAERARERGHVVVYA